MAGHLKRSVDLATKLFPALIIAALAAVFYKPELITIAYRFQRSSLAYFDSIGWSEAAVPLTFFGPPIIATAFLLACSYALVRLNDLRWKLLISSRHDV